MIYFVVLFKNGNRFSVHENSINFSVGRWLVNRKNELWLSILEQSNMVAPDSHYETMCLAYLSMKSSWWAIVTGLRP